MHWFVVPDLTGPTTGGTLYNRMLVTAANALGCPCAALALESVPALLARATTADIFWVDSLYLERLPELVGAARASTRVGLIAHYLPSLLTHGEGVRRDQLTSAEVKALNVASMYMVPSSFMGRMLARLTGGDRPILCVEPGRLAIGRAQIPEPPLRAVLVANLVPGKGVVPFLARLAEQTRPADDFRLLVVGSAALEPRYARRCVEAGGDARLFGRIEWCGELTPDDTLRVMAASNLLISASLFESYGMALAEARALGLPIVAHVGGNVANLVTSRSGGELVSGAVELATACLQMARDAREHRRRLALARANTLAPHTWAEAASNFVAQVAELDQPRLPAAMAEKVGAHAS